MYRRVVEVGYADGELHGCVGGSAATIDLNGPFRSCGARSGGGLKTGRRGPHPEDLGADPGQVLCAHDGPRLDPGDGLIGSLRTLGHHGAQSGGVHAAGDLAVGVDSTTVMPASNPMTAVWKRPVPAPSRLVRWVRYGPISVNSGATVRSRRPLAAISCSMIGPSRERWLEMTSTRCPWRSSSVTTRAHCGASMAVCPCSAMPMTPWRAGARARGASPPR